MSINNTHYRADLSVLLDEGQVCVGKGMEEAKLGLGFDGANMAVP